VGFGFGILPLAGFIAPYLSVEKTFGARQTYEAHYFSASGVSYFSAPALSWWYHGLSAFAPAEAQLFPGLVLVVFAALSFRRLGEAKALRAWYLAVIFFAVLALAFAAAQLPGLSEYEQRLVSSAAWWCALASCACLLAKLRRLENKLGFRIVTNRTMTGILWFAALVVLAVSCGPLGNEFKHQLALGPFMIFYEALPGFSAIRAISRIGVMAVFLFCVLAAVALSHLGKRLPRGAVWILLALVLAENRVTRFAHEYEPVRPAIFDQLDKLPRANDAVVVLPFAGPLRKGEVESWSEFARRNVNAMRWNFPSERFLMNGYSGQRTTIMKKWPAVLSGFPSRESVNLLSSVAGLHYIVYLVEDNPHFNEAAFEKSIEALHGSIAEAGRDVRGNYLLEYTGQRRLDEEFELSVPSVSGAKLTLQLMALGASKGESVKLKVFEGPSAEAKEEIAALALPSNGDWEMMTIPLSVPSGERVRPARLSFKTDAGHFVLLRQSRYDAQ
jgi:hypothetical protein